MKEQNYDTVDYSQIACPKCRDVYIDNYKKHCYKCDKEYKEKKLRGLLIVDLKLNGFKINQKQLSDKLNIIYATLRSRLLKYKDKGIYIINNNVVTFKVDIVFNQRKFKSENYIYNFNSLNFLTKENNKVAAKKLINVAVGETFIYKNKHNKNIKIKRVK